MPKVLGMIDFSPAEKTGINLAWDATWGLLGVPMNISSTSYVNFTSNFSMNFCIGITIR